MSDLERKILQSAIFSPYPFMEDSAWIGHLPFANYLMQEIKPKIFVELGTHWGHSYFSFCQTVKDENLDSKCYAIDTWAGDNHAGNYDETIFIAAQNHNNALYSDFSTLIKMRFEDAIYSFADKSIDLLHIDGFHTYEAVKRDFETWLPKITPNGYILIHDIHERGRNFGVWKFWEELEEKYPNTFEFRHSHGLGVLQIGGKSHLSRLKLFDFTQEEKHVLNGMSKRGDIIKQHHRR